MIQNYVQKSQHDGFLCCMLQCATSGWIQCGSQFTTLLHYYYIHLGQPG